ncbi:MAG TPA: SDR family oxidoreductase [Anaerolineaceae bacterium]|nr:SDR family oxidoreductase [Anaerolineaceae bacterium]
MSLSNEVHVIFGAGPVGRSLAKELSTRGKIVRLINRSGKLPMIPGLDALAGVEIAAGNAADLDSTRLLCAGADVVYNCTNPPYTRWPELFPALQAGVLAGAASTGAKLIVMENLYMYGPTGGQPLREDLPYAAKTRKGITRARMAEELLEAHARGKVRAAAGRAADFFGPGVLDSALGERIFATALEGKPAQVVGNADLPHTYTYIRDVARALTILGERDEALGKAWHLPSPETVSTRQIVELIETEIGRKVRLQAAPGWLVGLVGLFNPVLREVAEMAYEFEEPFILDASCFEEAFGLRATPLAETIHETVQWFQVHQNHKV